MQPIGRRARDDALGSMGWRDPRTVSRREGKDPRSEFVRAEVRTRRLKGRQHGSL